MSQDERVLLRHILESIESLENYLVGVSESEYLSNIEKQDAVERRLQIIGEAIVQLSQTFKDEHPDIAWAKIAGLRNRLVHEYFDIDHGLIWNTLSKSVPEFKQEIKELLSGR